MFGVLTGCDQNQEWLLNWWYSHFRKHHPDVDIAFADFGMSEQGRSWCKERGVLIEIPPIDLQPKNGFSFMGKTWTQTRYSKQNLSSSWFSKPSAMLLSPFKRTLWLDLDCEVRKSLQSLFSISLPAEKIRLRKHGTICIDDVETLHSYRIPGYNSGVVLFEKSSFLELWAQKCIEASTDFFSDDHVFSLFAVFLDQTNLSLSLKYNWNATCWGENTEALIYHWERAAGKNRLYLLRTIFEI